MLRWLKSQFVPHEINGLRPLFLRRESAYRLAGALIALELALFLLPTLYFPEYARDLNLGSVLPGMLSKLTNDERAQKGLPILAVNEKLAAAAKLKAEDMASKGYFAHNSPDGKAPWYWFGAVDYDYAFAGENLAVNFSDSEEVTRAWMNSPAHQANIVGRNYTEVGTGIASGVYKGSETVFVVQLYGKPKAVPAVTPAPARAVPKVTQKPVQTAPQSAVKTDAVAKLREPAQTQVNVPAAATSGELVLGESAPQARQLETGIVSRLMSSPKNVTNAVLYLALATVLIALMLAVFVRFDTQFPDLLANGAVVALLIIGLHLANNSWIASRVETSFIEISQASAPSPGA